MSGTIRSFRIFLSSPGDVADERTKARDLLLGLARGAFVSGHVHIDVVSWDDPHAPAPMDARLTPQQAVDKRLPNPADCDLTVVMLWSRLGTPLTETKADGTPYLSGTEWELETALAANKPVLLYRRSEKVLLDPDDPLFDEKLDQKRRVDGFFAGLTGDEGTIRRAHSSYASTADLLARLRSDVEHHLSDVLREVDADAPQAHDDRARPALRSEAGETSPHVPAAYREWVKKQHGGVDLLGLQLKKGRPPSLSTIYVPQVTSVAMPEALAKPLRRHGVIGPAEVLEPSLLLSRLATESLYVSGAPGTGKSTFSRWVVWLVAEGAMPSLDVLPPDDFTEILDEGLKGRLPVLLRLREFWEFVLPRAGASLTISDLEEAIGRWVEKKRPDGLDARLVRAHLEHGSALLVLDGMDEVPVGSTVDGREWHPRAQLLSALADACPAWTAAGNRLLLTSRPYGLSAEQAATTTTLESAPLHPLPRELQTLRGDPRFHDKGVWCLPNDPSLGFIKMEAGPFTMGSDPRKDRFAREEEQPQHVVDLPEYFVARYPVTVAQFKAFVEDAKFEVRDRDCLRGVPNHPVTWVSWHEALVYCRWLTDKLRASEATPGHLRERLTSGWVITLPSEAEWEKAARGTDGRTYPWGDQFDATRANGAEVGLAGTSAVGLFANGASPCGAADMIGNVWEWTRSLWGEDFDEPSHKYPYKPGESVREALDAPNKILRVVRGGSFVNPGYSLRAAYRSRYTPDYRDGHYGFRVVSSRLRS